MPEPQKIDYARNGDIHIAYQTIGDGPIDVVAVLGWATNLDLFWEWPAIRRFYEGIGSFSRLIMFDKRGTGLSDRTTTLPTLEEMGDDIRAVMDAVGSERAALFGFAEGGPPSCMFAAAHPERVTALVLYGSFARRLTAPDYPWGIPPEMVGGFEQAVAERWGREPVALGLMAPSMKADQRFREYWVKAQRHGASPGAAIEWYRMTLELDARDILPTIRRPVLVIHRKGDRIVPIENGRYLAEHIPSARLIELDGDDHAIMVDPDQIVAPVQEFLTGSVRAPEVDRVLATVLFTDIVGSTATAARLGDRKWRELLDDHDAIVLQEIDRWRGTVIKNRGDGFLATFDGPARGIRAAAAAAARIRALGIEIRAGLHTGECELRSGDITGIAVDIGARVNDLAAPSEILVSSTVKDLVVGSGIAFVDRGAHSLKGVPDEWRLYAVGEDAR